MRKREPIVDQPAPDDPPQPKSRRWMAWLPLGFIILCVTGYLSADWYVGIPASAEATYVGRQSCVSCHQPQDHAFTGSHHDRAMALANSESVLGDFNDTTLTHYGVTSRMFRRDEKFWINTEGPNGKLSDFEIKYVFGVEPLQQYMVELDRPAELAENEIGRVQVLRVSWDTKKKEWFHLDPPDVKAKLAPDDDLHWTGVAQRWNTMCADCHSTNLHRNFDPATNRYHTTFSEINVSCETCHGPGSLHNELAYAWSPFWDRERGYAIASFKGKPNVAEVESCAPCHSRRRIVHPEFKGGDSYHDFYANDLLHRMGYHADGAILDEVYEYGSFTQSKMFHKNIKCSDCHDPHSAKLKHEGNKVCTSCHQHPAGKYDSPAHHHHAPGTAGAACVECHMPTTTYMEVDPRRDHGFRVPRPDLSAKYDTPNACSECHLQDVKTLAPEKRKSLKQYADWLARRTDDVEIDAALRKVDDYCAAGLAKWYPPQKRKEDEIVPALFAARKGLPSSQELLANLAKSRELPAIFRATALQELGQFARPGSVSVETSIKQLNDSSPQVRAAAIQNLEGLEPRELRKHIAPLLADSSRLVRTEAMRVLARIKPILHGDEHHQFEQAFYDYMYGLAESDDRASSHLAEAAIHESLRELDIAEECYRTAMRIEPRVTGPRTNLAALLDRRVEQAQAASREAMRARDQEGAVALMEPVASWQILAESLRKEELELLARDVKLVPKDASLRYRYGLLLYLFARNEEATKELREAVRLEPNQAEFHMALALLLEKNEEFAEALDEAEKALTLFPEDPGYQETVARLRQATR